MSDPLTITESEFNADRGRWFRQQETHTVHVMSDDGESLIGVLWQIGAEDGEGAGISYDEFERDDVPGQMPIETIRVISVLDRRRIRAEVAREWADKLEALEAVEQDSAESIDTAGELYALGGRVALLSQIRAALLQWADDEEAGKHSPPSGGAPR